MEVRFKVEITATFLDKLELSRTISTCVNHKPTKTEQWRWHQCTLSILWAQFLRGKLKRYSRIRRWGICLEAKINAPHKFQYLWTMLSCLSFKNIRCLTNNHQLFKTQTNIAEYSSILTISSLMELWVCLNSCHMSRLSTTTIAVSNKW
jgi:hypothetical protein